VLIIQQGRYALLLFLVFILSCKSISTIQRVESKQYVFSDSSNSEIDSSAWKLIKPYRDTLDITMNQVIAYSNQALIKGNPEGLLGDFAADACSNIAKSTSIKLNINSQDFTFLNNGGLRTSLPKGEITRRNIYELMPFENELVIVNLSGEQALQLLNFIADHGGSPVSGITMKIENKKAIDIKINGFSFESSKKYKILTSDYLANGGDNLTFLKNAKKESLNLKVRDAMIYYLEELNKKGDSLNIKLDGRIRNN